MEASDEDWSAEADAVINDIKDHVQEAFVSNQLSSSKQKIYINLKTLEGNRYCVMLTAKGFEIVGNDFDKQDKSNDIYYETPYSLLQSISPKFVTSFGGALTDKLQSLQSDSD